MIGKRWLSVVVLGLCVALASVCWAAPGDVDGVSGVELKDAETKRSAATSRRGLEPLNLS